MNKISTIGERIRQARKKERVSQTTLGKAIGINDYSYYGRKERGEVRFSDAELLDIAGYLGRNFQWLKLGVGEEFPEGTIRESDFTPEEVFTKGVVVRFNQQFNEYVATVHRGSVEAACRELHIKPNTYRRLKGGFQGFSQEALQALCRYGNFDVNFLLANKGTAFIEKKASKSEMERLQAELEELRRDKENLTVLIQMYRDKYETSGQHRKRA